MKIKIFQNDGPPLEFEREEVHLTVDGYVFDIWEFGQGQIRIYSDKPLSVQTDNAFSKQTTVKVVR